MEKIAINPEINELTEFVNTGKSVAFIGSGLSMGAYIGWRELVTQLCDACGTNAASGDEDLLELAQQAKIASPDEYHRVLSEEFGKNGVHTPPGYRYLIECPFNAYITVNYDPLLAQEGQFKELALYDFKSGLDSSRVKKKAIFYIHGYVAAGALIKDGDLILTKDDFEHNYEHSNSLIPSFLTQVLSHKPVVFIGCALQEPALKKILGICNEIKSRIENFSQNKGPTHYILLPTLYIKKSDKEKLVRDVEKEAEEDTQYKKIGVRVIRYVRNSPDDYSPVESILREWSNVPQIKPVSAYEEGPNYD